MTGLPAHAVSIAAGLSHSCAALDNGQVWCWGANLDGRLGNGTLLPAFAPVRAQGITTAVQVTVGDAHSCARLDDGTVQCWGSGLSGRLGNDSILNRLTPVLVSGLSDARAVAAGAQHTCALRASGDVVCWGVGLLGELGRGSILDSWAPVPVSSSLPAGRTTELDAGRDFSCARTDNGRVYCWGANLFGQLGDGTSIGRLTPVNVPAVHGAAFVATGDAHACAVGVDGAIACWGANLTHQLGVNVPRTPVPVNLCSP